MTPENAAFILGAVAGATVVSFLWSFAWLRVTRKATKPGEFHGDQL